MTPGERFYVPLVCFLGTRFGSRAMRNASTLSVVTGGRAPVRVVVVVDIHLRIAPAGEIECAFLGRVEFADFSFIHREKLAQAVESFLGQNDVKSLRRVVAQFDRLAGVRR